MSESESASTRLSHGDRASIPTRLDALLRDSKELLVLQGPAGVGKRTLGEQALLHLRLSPLRVDAAALRTFEEVLDAVVAQSDSLTIDAASDGVQLSASLRAQRRGVLLCDADVLEREAWEPLHRWLCGDTPLPAVITRCQPMPPGVVVPTTVLPVSPWSWQVASELRAAWGVFVDAVANEGLRQQLDRADEGARASVVETCGGLPLLLRLAGARTRLLDGHQVLALLMQAESPEHLLALHALFGTEYTDALQRTLQRLPSGAQALLPLCLQLGPTFTIDDVLRVLQTLQERDAGSDDPDARWVQQRVALLRGQCVDLLGLLADVGVLEVVRDDAGAAFRLPRHMMAVLDALLPDEPAERPWRARLPGATVAGLASGAARLLEASDTHQEQQARDLGRRLREPLVALLRRTWLPDGMSPAGGLQCLGALAWFWRRTGVDRRHWPLLFQRVLDTSSPERFGSEVQRGPGADRLAHALCEVHLLARQAGDAAARDALATRMGDLMWMFDDAWDRGAASARSRLGYVLAAAAFTAGDRGTARSLAERAVDDARSAARHDLQARHATVLAFVEFEAGEHATAVARMEESVSVLARLGATHEYVTASINMAILAYQHGAIDMSAEAFAHAASGAEGLWDQALQARALLGLARSLDVLQAPEAAEIHARTLALTERIADEAQRAEALMRWGWHLLFSNSGAANSALDMMRQAIDLEQRVGRERLRTHSMHALALALGASGDLEGARYLAAQTLARIPAARRQHHLEVAALVAALHPDAEEAALRLEEFEAQGAELDSEPTRILLAAERVWVDARRLREATRDPGADSVLQQRVADRLRWLMEPVPPPFGASRSARPRWQRSLTLAATMRRAASVLDPALVAELEAALYHQPGELLVSADGTRTRTPDGSDISLHATPVLARILVAIASDTIRHGVCNVDACLEAGWPGERIQHDAALNRLYQAISRLRRSGLRELVEAHEGGYRIANGVRVVISPRI